MEENEGKGKCFKHDTDSIVNIVNDVQNGWKF